MLIFIEILLLKHPDLKIKAASAKRLGTGNRPLAIRSLKKTLLKKNNISIADEIARAIKNIGGSKAREALYDALNSDESSIRLYAAKYLIKLCSFDPGNYFGSYIEKAVNVLCNDGDENHVKIVAEQLKDSCSCMVVTNDIQQLLDRCIHNVKPEVLLYILEKNDSINRISYGGMSTSYCSVSLVPIKDSVRAELNRRKNS